MMSDYVHMVNYVSFPPAYNTWLQAGDRLFVAVVAVDFSIIFNPVSIDYPFQDVAYSDINDTMPIRYVCVSFFVARDIDGLYDILSTPAVRFAGLRYNNLFVPARK
jgi:hypothetical protein